MPPPVPSLASSVSGPVRTARAGRRSQSPTGRRAAAWLPILLGLLLGACAVGPDFHRPAVPGDDAYTRAPLPAQTAAVPDAAGAGTPQALQPGADLPADWWRLFRSPQLDALVRQALHENPNVQSAQAALRQAHQLVLAQWGSLLPGAQASLSATRQKNPVATLSPTLSSGAPIFNLYSPQLSVGYAPDLFGGQRRALESLQAQEQYQRFELEATRITLAANVVSSAIQEAALRAQLAATERMFAIQTEQLRILRKELELGAVAQADVAAQQAALAQTAGQVAPLRKQLAIERDLLTALVGRLPSQEPSEIFELDHLRLPEALPLGVPSRLVERRPDVRAAEAQMHAASAAVGVAISDMLPQLTLSASAGGDSTSFAHMLANGNRFWSAGASLTQTLFDAGASYRREQAAVAGLDQAGAQYRAAVLAAFQNVADTLHAVVFDAEALRAAVESEQASEKSWRYARAAYDLGAVSHLAQLNAEQAYQQAVASRIQAQSSRYLDSVALYVALGGGWWNAAPEPAPSDPSPGPVQGERP